MLRMTAGLLSLTFCIGSAMADNPDPKANSNNKGNQNNTTADKNTSNASDKGREAKITKVDSKNHTLTLKLKDKNGKETERTFALTEEVRYADSTGKVVAMDVFKSGDYVLAVEADGKLKEVRQADKSTERNK